MHRVHRDYRQACARRRLRYFQRLCRLNRRPSACATNSCDETSSWYDLHHAGDLLDRTFIHSSASNSPPAAAPRYAQHPGNAHVLRVRNRPESFPGRSVRRTVLTICTVYVLHLQYSGDFSGPNRFRWSPSSRWNCLSPTSSAYETFALNRPSRSPRRQPQSADLLETQLPDAIRTVRAALLPQLCRSCGPHTLDGSARRGDGLVHGLRRVPCLHVNPAKNGTSNSSTDDLRQRGFVPVPSAPPCW